jgi:hypothetical protein
MEHARIKDWVGNLYQWVDAELCIVIDTSNGKPLQFDSNGVMATYGGAVLVPLETALREIRRSPQDKPSYAIIRVNAIVPYPIEPKE